MEFNLDAISSALDEILEYHKDIEQLDTYSSRSRSHSQRDFPPPHVNESAHPVRGRSEEEQKGNDGVGASAAAQARAQDAKHLNDSRWGEDYHVPEPIVRRQATRHTREKGTASPVPSTGAVVAASPRTETPAATRPPPAQPLAPRPRNREHSTGSLAANKPAVQTRYSPSHTDAGAEQHEVRRTAQSQPAPRSAGAESDQTMSLPVELISASGLGAATVLARSAAKEGSSGPHKQWLTYYAKSVAPSVLLHCPSATHAPNQLVEEVAPTSQASGHRITRTRDMHITARLQFTVSELETIPTEEWGVLTIACSQDAKRGFLRVAESPVRLDHAEELTDISGASPPSSPGQWPLVVTVPVTVAGSLLAPYMKLTLTPRREVVQTTHVCRVTYVGFEWAASWTSQRMSLPAVTPPTLREQFDGLTSPAQGADTRCASDADEGDDAGDREDAHAVEWFAGTPAVPTAPPQQQLPPTAMETPPRRMFHDAPPLQQQQKQAERQVTDTTSLQAGERVGSYYYNWRYDSFYDGSPSATVPESAAAMETMSGCGRAQASSNASFGSSTWGRALDADTTAETNSREDRDEDLAQRRLAEVAVWDGCPLWSVAQCLAFGQQQAAFFSLAIAHAEDVTRRVGLLSLASLPFAFHVCAIRFRQNEGMSSLHWLAALNESLLNDGLRLDLAARVLGGGFLGSVCDAALCESTAASPPRWVLIVPCTSTDDVVSLLQKCHATTTHVAPTLAELPLYGSGDADGEGAIAVDDRCCLRIVLDWTRSFDALLPVLRAWCRLTPSVQYYGARRQSPLAHFVQRRDGDAGELGRLPAVLWSGVIMDGDEVMVSLDGLSGSSDVGSSTSSYRTPLLALTLTRCCPFFRVWQSRSAPSSPRVVLTNQHVLQSMNSVHGVLAPPAVKNLAKDMLTHTTHVASPDGVALSSDAASFLDRLVVVNEAPWQALMQTLESRHHYGPQQKGGARRVPSAAAEILSSRSAAALAEERARTTRAWLFHALTTAFRREWGVVGLCVPSCVLSMSRGTEDDGLTGIDDDAFMDTLLRWDYPYPRAVVVFHGTTSADTVPPRLDGTEDDNAVLRTCFSYRGLQHFASVETLEEAVA